MKRSQRGITLTGAIVGMAILAFVGLFAAKLLPSYLEYFAVQKMFKAMENAGETKGNVKEIRRSFDKRNAVEQVNSVRSEDLEITKEGGEAVVTATWSTKIPIIYNFNACLDFTVSTAK
jgi:type II secretory pathway pseudopilin PulG